MPSFRGTRDIDEQPSSSYCLPVAEMAYDILKDLNEKMASPRSGMHSKMSKLLSYPSIRGDVFTQHLLLLCSIIELRALSHPII